MTLMWRHRNRPGVPERDVELAGPPFEGKTENYPPQGGDDSVPASTPTKSWSKERFQEWAAENGVELTPDGTKAQWLEEIAAGSSETQETADETNEVNPEGVTPNGEGEA